MLLITLLLAFACVAQAQAQVPMKPFAQAFTPGPMPAPEPAPPPPEIPPPPRELPPPLPPLQDGDDDWSVLTEAEIMAALGGEPADMVAPWKEGLAEMVVWGGIGFLLLLGLLVRMVHMKRRTRSLRPRLHWALWLPLLVFLLPLPLTLPHFFKETYVEVLTRWLEASRQPLLLQGSVRHAETGEPLAGVWVSYSLKVVGRYYAGPPSCAVDFVLRTDAQGNWRIELPPREFGRYMAEHADIDPIPFLYAPGLQQEWGAWMNLLEGRDLASSEQQFRAIRKYGRLQKGHARERMLPDRRPIEERLAGPGGGVACRDARVVGSREALTRARLREQRELRCSREPEASRWPREALNLRPLTYLNGRMAQFEAFLRGLEPETSEYDEAVCQFLDALAP